MEIKPIVFDIKDLLLKGKLASVEIGMTQEEVINHLGKPHSIGEDKQGGFMDFYYGSFEIFFYNFLDDSGIYKVQAFQNDHLDAINGFDTEDKNILVNTWFLYTGMGFDEAMKALIKEDLWYKIEKKYEFVFIVFENGSEIGFTQSDIFPDKDLVLTVVEYCPRF